MNLDYKELERTGMLPRMINLKICIDKFQRNIGMYTAYTDKDLVNWINKGMDRMGLTHATMTQDMEPHVLIASLICSGMCNADIIEKARNALDKMSC